MKLETRNAKRETFVPLFLLLASCFLLLLGGCAGPGIGPDIAAQRTQTQQLVDAAVAAQQALTEARAGLAEVHAQAEAAKVTTTLSIAADGQQTITTQPAPAPIVKAAEKVSQAAARADHAVAPAQQIAGQLVPILQELTKRLDKAESRDEAIAVTLQSVAAGVKVAAPQTAPYVDLAQIAAGLVIGLTGILMGHKTAKTAITTPGTTEKT